MTSGRNLLLVGGHGVEVVECGGATAKNARAGGCSSAVILLAREGSRPPVQSAGFTSGEAAAEPPS